MKKLIIKIILFFICLPFLIFIRILYPVIVIRFHPIVSTRIGHFLANVETYLCKKKYFKKKNKKIIIDIHFYNKDVYAKKKICNLQVDLMVRRLLVIFPTNLIFPLWYFNNFFPDSSKFLVNNTSDRDPLGLYDIYENNFKFNEIEIAKGEEKLCKIGIPSGSKFVCLNVRDNSYLKKTSSNNFDYHSYRNWDISNFEEAIKELIANKIYVVRVGKFSEKNTNINSNFFIDITNSINDDFLDIYLGANCYFCISTQTGFDAIPYVFRRPIAYITVPISHFHTSSRRYFLFTKYHIFKSKKKLNLKEIFEKNFHDLIHTNDFKNNNVELLDLSKYDLKLFIKDMLIYVSNDMINYTDLDLQNLFWDTYKKKINALPKKKIRHGKFEATISPSLLKQLL